MRNDATSTTDAAYRDFLASKRVRTPSYGFNDVNPDTLNALLFDWQAEIVAWALRRGRAALFLDCGMGKTPCQLAWANEVTRRSGGDVLILAPLAVTSQTRREGEKFDIPVTVCRSQDDVQPGINITNYELLAKFDAEHFAGVVLDESAILRSYTGKVKQAIIAAFAATPYRLACTATPAPNDHMELGNHSEFLGAMPAPEMLMRWFINDTTSAGTWRLKGHAESDFWAWVASWAVSARKPSDLGYSDDGFELPPLQIRHETVAVDMTIDAEDGQLFRTPTLNATKLHQEMRRTAHDRAERVAALVNGNSDAWTVWCNTDYEADELKRLIPDAVEVRGSEPATVKERKLTAFTEGKERVIVTKPKIAGYGLNWQHCHRTVFVGLSYSMDAFYQAIRRHYRFRQEHAVEAVVVAAETEGPVVASIERKLKQFDEMGASMVAASHELLMQRDRTLEAYTPHTPMYLPVWLGGAA